MERFRQFAEVFRLSNKEFRAQIILAVLCLVIITLKNIYLAEKSSFTLTHRTFDGFDSIQAQNQFVAEKQKDLSTYDSLTKGKQKVVIEFFDPNVVDAEKLISFGLSKKQVASWIHFRERGGVFFKDRDICKLYCLTDLQKRSLMPFVRISKKEVQSQLSSQKNEKPYEPSSRKVIQASLDINSCTSQELEELPGIGNVLAERIVKYRNRLGGFASLDQLSEVYGLDQEKIRLFVHRLRLNDKKVNRIQINLDNDSIIKKHPYFNYKMLRLLSAYKKQHVYISGKDDLMKIPVFNDSIIRKIEPYIDFRH
jgi:competence ComEA-like helix-hairpin-helix protein